MTTSSQCVFPIKRSPSRQGRPEITHRFNGGTPTSTTSKSPNRDERRKSLSPLPGLSRFVSTRTDESVGYSRLSLRDKSAGIDNQSASASIRRNGSQMIPGEQPGIMLIGPANSECIVAAQRHFQQSQISRHRLRIQDLPPREFIHAHRTTTVLTNPLKRQTRNFRIGPDQFQDSLFLVHSDIAGRLHDNTFLSVRGTANSIGDN